MKKIFAARWATTVALAASALVALPAQATPAGDNVVINEVYANGGSAGASYKTKFVELYNPTDKDISVSGWSLQYRTAAGTSTFSG
ncbi:MAG: lamin tail domain-containing protein, partial [Kineosporiaceae bacterium]|nr:lamin tail domain-containing protein [Aeromicrobium sp.]